MEFKKLFIIYFVTTLTTQIENPKFVKSAQASGIKQSLSELDQLNFNQNIQNNSKEFPKQQNDDKLSTSATDQQFSATEWSLATDSPSSFQPQILPNTAEMQTNPNILLEFLNREKETEENVLKTNTSSAKNNDLLFNYVTTKLLAIDVQCSTRSMIISLKFDTPFNGGVYSKDYYHVPDCHYVPFQSGKTDFKFEIKVNHCGAQLINTNTNGNLSIEDVIVVQNDEEIQGMWDTAHNIRCKVIELSKTVINTAFHVAMHDPIDVSYTENKVNAFMDIQLGRGPHSTPVTGMVKIGTTLTLVIAVIAAEEFDIQVKECLAHSGNLKMNKSSSRNVVLNDAATVRMSDENGCILKPKLLSPWRTMLEKTENSDFKMMAYSYLQAFKFPDKVEVFLECNLEICKNQCHKNCEWKNSQLGERKRRETEDILEQVKLLRTLKVVSNEDIQSISNISDFELGSADQKKQSTNVCLTLLQFIISIVAIFIVFVVSCMVTAILALRRNIKTQLATAILMDRFAIFENISRQKTINN